jgi:putative addiction module component (TIGR02574 family)
MAFQLPEIQRAKLASALLDSIPPHRPPVTLEELKRRADEVETGKVKPVSSVEFDAHIARLRTSPACAHRSALDHCRPAQRGSKPGPANSRIRGGLFFRLI